ncbi:MAG TPA: 4a-hydroxytetrahydrobiopterin dehydratase [Flavobacteriales bacterium]|jgi:4a-hydroxytetrahydrobiopterin dehydratase|nr:4a-hydroxytetrahydrobiopterin dehydratase [Flavobacteriales bacterium]
MNNWNENPEALVREFTFENFVEAVGFVNKIVPLAEGMNHHPDIEIYSYRKVRVRLFTHDKNQITEKDFLLAESINQLID